METCTCGIIVIVYKNEAFRQYHCAKHSPKARGLGAYPQKLGSYPEIEFCDNFYHINLLADRPQEEEATESKGATLLIFYCKNYIPMERPLI